MSPGSEVIVKWLLEFSQVRISTVDVCLSNSNAVINGIKLFWPMFKRSCTSTYSLNAYMFF